MVAMIGIMIGLYVLARCAELAEGPHGAIVKTLAVLAFIGNMLGIMLLFSGGFGTPVPTGIGVR